MYLLTSWAVVPLALSLWGCPTDPATSTDPDPDQAVADGAADTAVSVDAAPPRDATPLRDAAPPRDAAPLDATELDARVPADAAQPTDAHPVDTAEPDAAELDAASPDAEPDAGEGRPPPLQCAAVRDLGGACYGDDRACVPGLTCVSGFCLGRSGAGGDCDGTGDCDGALYCRQYSLNGEALAVGICTARGEVGAACHRRNFGCEFGLTCIDDVCVERSMVGGVCLTTGDCDNTTWCDQPNGADRGSCVLFFPEGAPCDPRNSGCGPGFACLDGVCGMRQPMGGGCQSAADCQPGQYCDRYEADGNPRVEAICLARSARGEACEAREASNCQSSRCIQGTCAADQPLGAPCDSTFDCAAGGFCPQP